MSGSGETTLGEVCTLLNGRAYKKVELLESGKYPVLRVGNFFSNRSWYHSDLELDENKYCDEGDLLYAWSASFGPRIWTGPKVIFHYHIWKVLVDEERADKRFLYHWFDWDTDQIRAEQGTGATMLHVTKGAMEERAISLPPLADQKRIVSILDEAFGAIERVKEIAETNLANARELFESYLNRVFTEKGEGWEERRLGDLTVLRRGHNPPKSQFVYSPQKGYVRFWQIRDGWSDKNAVYVPDSPKLHRVEENDILLVAYRHVGRRFRGVSGAFNVALCCITNANESVLNTDYLFHLIPTSYVRGELLKRSERSLIPSMSVKHLAELMIPVPPIEQQYKIVARLEEQQAIAGSLDRIYQQKLTALEELKQSILQKAFTGQLTAKSPELEAVS